MVVSTTDVRDFLNKISEQRIHDEVIAAQLSVATTQIENSIAAGVRDVDKDNAIKVYAAYLSYQAYCTEYERTAGQVPPFMVGHLNMLGSLAGTLINLTRKGAPEYTCPVSQNTSMEEQMIQTGSVDC